MSEPEPNPSSPAESPLASSQGVQGARASKLPVLNLSPNDKTYAKDENDEEKPPPTESNINFILGSMSDIPAHPISREESENIGEEKTTEAPNFSIFKTQLSQTKYVAPEQIDRGPEIEAAIDEFKHTGKAYFTLPQSCLVQAIQRDKVDSILKGDYDKAEEYDNLSKTLVFAIAKEAHDEKKKERMSSIETKINEARNELFCVQRTWDIQIHSFEEAMKDKIRSFGEEKEKELLDFEDKWNDEDFLRQFSKPSSRLLQLKSMERSMVITKMFEKAKAMRKEADALEKSETANAQMRANEEMNRQRDRIVVRQDREIYALKEKMLQQLEQLKRSKDVEERPCKAKLAKLERTIEDLKNGIDPPVNPKVDGEGSDELLTPRTASKFSNYKSMAKCVKLKVKPLGSITETARRKCLIGAKAASIVKPSTGEM